MDETKRSDSVVVVRGNRAWALTALPAEDAWWGAVERGLIPRTAVFPDRAPPGTPSILARYIPDEWWSNCQSPGSPSLELLHMMQDERSADWTIVKRTWMPQGLLLSPDSLVTSLENLTLRKVATQLARGLLREMGGN